MKGLCRRRYLSVAGRLALQHRYVVFQPVYLAGVDPERVELEAKKARSSQTGNAEQHHRDRSNDEPAGRGDDAHIFHRSFTVTGAPSGRSRMTRAGGSDTP